VELAKPHQRKAGRTRWYKKRAATLVLLLIAPPALYLAARPNRCSDRVTLTLSPIESTRKGTVNLVNFPGVSAKTLAGKCVAFPEVTKGKIGVIFVAFQQSAQSQIDTWLPPMISSYLENDAVSYYEIPMISGSYKPFSRLIDGGMRGGVPSSLHERTATFYGRRSKFFSSMAITDTSRAYLFVLSRNGEIVFRADGPATGDSVRLATEAIESEIAKPDGKVDSLGI
jgi:ATP10 protein